MKKTGKRIMLYVAYAIGAILLLLAGLSVASRFISNHGLVEGRLQVCASKNNCVCTEDYPDCHSQPLDISNLQPERAWPLLINIVRDSGGEIQQDNAGYLWATFTTPLLRFVDDVEFRLDENGSRIHMRSASRVGKGDLGANEKRIQRITEQFRARTTTQDKNK